MSTNIVYVNRDVVTVDDEVVNIVGIGSQGAQGIQGIQGPAGTTYAPPNQTRTLYVGKHGNDANDGLNIEEAKLTFGAALTIAAAATSTLRYQIWCMDGGIYTESITVPQYCSIIAPGAILQGTISTQGDLTIRFYRVEATGNGQTLVSKSGANTTAYVEIMELDGSAFSNVQCVNNLSNNGIIFARIGKCLVGAGGTGIGDQTNGIGHMHANIEDLYLAGNNAVGIAKTSGTGNIVGYVQHILEINSPTGTTGITVGATGEVYMSFNQIIADTAWNVTAGGILRGWAGDVSGVQTGAAEMVTAMTGAMSLQLANAVAITGGTINGATIGASTPSSGIFTTLQANTSLSVASDTDATTILGRTRLDSRISDVAIFSHVDMTATGQYAISQSASGETLLNAASGQSIGFRINNSTAVGKLNAMGLRIGDNNTPSALLHLVKIDANTNDVQTIAFFDRNCTNVPTDGYGTRLYWRLNSSTTDDSIVAALETTWATATHASYKARQQYLIYDAGGAREALRLEASGTAAMIGFLGAAAVIRQALGAWAGLTDAQKLDALRDALTNLGLTSYT